MVCEQFESTVNEYRLEFCVYISHNIVGSDICLGLYALSASSHVDTR